MSEFAFPEEFKPPHKISVEGIHTPVLVAFSGGADSSLLLYLLYQYKLKYGTEIYAAHLNHMIRGEEAKRDAEFCARIAAGYDIELFSRTVDIPKIAEETGESLELAARRQRYAFFREIMNENNFCLLATAHNATDNAETVIFNMSRGSGGNGICGIPEYRVFDPGKFIIRPILGMTKARVLEYTEKFGIEYVTDSTNADTSYSRNNIRANVIPRLKEVNPAAEMNILRMCRLARQDMLFLDRLADDLIRSLKIKVKTETVVLPMNVLEETEKPIFIRVMNKIFEKVFGGTLEEVHLHALWCQVHRGNDGSALSLPCSMQSIIDGENLVLRHEPDRTKNTTEIAEQTVPQNIPLSQGYNNINVEDGVFICDCDVYNKNGTLNGEKKKEVSNIYKIATSVYFNFDNIKGVLYLRRRNEGDTIKTGGMTRKLKKLLCDKKIPQSTRAVLPLLCDDEGIVWVPFIGLRDDVKVKSDGHTAYAAYYTVKELK